MKFADNKEKKKCGGTTIRPSMTEFNMDLYRNVVCGDKLRAFSNQKRFQSSRHNMMLISAKKRGFDAFDDKRFILEDGVQTMAHGHYKIPEILANWNEDEQMEEEEEVRMEEEEEEEQRGNDE